MALYSSRTTKKQEAGEGRENKMVGISMMFLKTLAITHEGKCVRHPEVSIFVNEEDTEATLHECEACWKDQQERKEASMGDVTSTTASTSLTLGSDHNINRGGDSPPSPGSKEIPPSLESHPSVTATSWVDSVNNRWTQVQEGSFACLSNRQPMEDYSGRSHGSYSINPLLNMSMAAVAEEPEDRTASQTVDTQTISTAGLVPTSAQWNRLEDQVARQDACIQKLQDTVEQQEATIRQDLERLMKLVSTVAANQQQQIQQQADAKDVTVPPTTGLFRAGTGVSAHTPVVSNAAAVGQPQRPTLYDKNFQHPANIFTSVRTIERRPPRPPMRHGSFSTQTHASTRRNSVDSSKLASIVSSMGNSTYNDATTYNDTTTHNDTTAPSISQTHDNVSINEDDIKWGAGFGPGIESILERERSQPLDIIFDASAAISTDLLLEEINALDQKFSKDEEAGDENDEKKTSSPSSSTGRKSPLPCDELREKAPNRDALQKMQGSIRLEIPSETSLEEAIGSQSDQACSEPLISKSKFHSDSELPPLNSNMPLASGRFLSRPSNSPHSNKGMRQPRREPSNADFAQTTPKVTHTANQRPTAPSRSRNFTHPNKYVRYNPPPPPPKVTHGNGTAEQSNRADIPNRLNMRNLSKLGKNTAPPRREIFATGISKMQISCLTIDTSLLEESEPIKPAYENTHSLEYREVTNFALTDKFGDKGMYTGTLRDAEGVVRLDVTNGKEQEEKQQDNDNENEKDLPRSGIAHGGGTMNYDGGRFYCGEWRDGHWHGSGLLRNSNGDSYEGDFVYDARHGHGIYKYENGDVYEGDFTEDKRHGKGTFIFHSGSVYRGDFVGGDFEGYGWYEFPEGYYEGEWVGGAYAGIGTLQYTDGGSYTGRFLEGKAHGLGEEKDADGTIRRGVWSSGELAESQEHQQVSTNC